jgi:hypothetical protein
MFLSVADWLERNALPCFYKKYFGIDCPGCGMQRAFIELLRGNVWESLKAYPALLPIIFMLVYLCLHLKYKYKKGAYILKITFIFTAILIVINFVFKLLLN